VILHPKRLDVPLRWKRPRLVFVNSMSDLFHELIPPEFVAEVFAVMALADHHVFQVLTKRPAHMHMLLTDARFWLAVGDALEDRGVPELARAVVRASCDGVLPEFPNVWLGVSVESRRHADRADVLRVTPAAHRFISAEPLLGALLAPTIEVEVCEVDGRTCPVSQVSGTVDGTWLEARRDWTHGDDLYLGGIDWLIAGGESGGHFDERPERFLVDRANHGRPRPEALTIVRDLRDACAAAGTHFTLKQWGGQTPKSAGRKLDGETHDWTPPRAGATLTA